MNLHIYHVIGEEGEDDEEHLLIMPLVVRVVTIWNGAEEGFEQLHGFLHILFVECLRYAASRVGGNQRVASDISWNQSLGQSHSYLIVRNVEGVVFICLVVSLDGDISALVEQGNDGRHVLRRGIKLAR